MLVISFILLRLRYFFNIHPFVALELIETNQTFLMASFFYIQIEEVQVATDVNGDL